MSAELSLSLLKFFKLWRLDPESVNIGLEQACSFLLGEYTDEELDDMLKANKRGLKRSRQVLHRKTSEDTQKIRIQLSELKSMEKKPLQGDLKSGIDFSETGSDSPPTPFRDRVKLRKEFHEQNLESLRSADATTALIELFLVGLTERVNNFDALDEIDLKSAPLHIRLVFNEACQCYLNGQKYATTILCGVAIEASIVHRTGEKVLGLREAFEDANKHNIFEDFDLCGIEDHLNRLRNDAVHHSETFEKVGPEEWMYVLGNTKRILQHLFPTKD